MGSQIATPVLLGQTRRELKQAPGRGIVQSCGVHPITLAT